jgi:protein TonB
MVTGILLLALSGGIDIAKYCPEKAIYGNVEGRATIECVVQPNGSLKACKVLSETPKDYGFGRATVRMFEKEAKVNNDGEAGQPHAPGDRMKFTFEWRLK